MAKENALSTKRWPHRPVGGNNAINPDHVEHDAASIRLILHVEAQAQAEQGWQALRRLVRPTAPWKWWQGVRESMPAARVATR